MIFPHMVISLTLGILLGWSTLVTPGISVAGSITGGSGLSNSMDSHPSGGGSDIAAQQMQIQPPLPPPPPGFGTGAINSTVNPAGEQVITQPTSPAGSRGENIRERDKTFNLPLVIAFGISLALNIYFITARLVFRNR